MISRRGFLGLMVLSALSYCKVENAKSFKEGEGAPSNQVKAGYYTCPMHPQIHEDGPGKCPICHMDLVFKAGDFQKPQQAAQSRNADPSEPQVESMAVPASLVLPSSCVLDTGTRTVVFVRNDSSKQFAPRVVNVMRIGKDFKVVKNLSPGERVAMDAAFILDSETNLSAKVRP
ncbi:MAG: hypothetical protein JNM27_00010 [Leptospirales bacterium]|nr:hypothetical protein [Leptospirales bacterium]